MTRFAYVFVAAATAVASLAGCAPRHLSETVAGDIPGTAHPALTMRTMSRFGGGSLNDIPAGLGVNIHFYEGNEKDWKMLTEAGVGIVRMDVSWARCEREPGVYDFGHYDKLIKRLGENQIRLLFIIDYGNPLYDDGLAPHTEDGRQAYARFVKALVSRYKGKHILWELWNEPNIGFWKPKPNVKDYMDWCKAVVPAIRDADPEACVIAPATSGIAIGFLEECFRRGLLELVDGVSVHPYRRIAPETALREYRRLDRIIRRYTPLSEKGEPRRRIPILSGEWGYSTTWISDELQGKYLPRQWLANMAAGVPISIWYDWHDDGKDPKEKEHNFGTVTWDYKPKPAYVAMKTLISQLRGYEVIHRIELDSKDDFAVVAREYDDRFKLAIWTTGDPHEIELGPDIRITAAVDHLGKEIDVPSGSRQPVTDAPRYLTVASPPPGWLRILPIYVEATACPTVFTRRSGPSHSDWQRDCTAQVHIENRTEKKARITLESVRSEDSYVLGEWIHFFHKKSHLTLKRNDSAFAAWIGDVPQHNHPSTSLTFPVRVVFEGETPHTITKTVEVGVSHVVSLDLVWRQDGLQLSVEKSGTKWLGSTVRRPLRGRIIPTVDGVDGRAVGVVMDEEQSRAVVRWDEIRISGVPRHVGARLEDQAGNVIAEVEPMTYELVEVFDDPVGDGVTDHFALWHEGEPKRKITLEGTIIESPGDDPPFETAAEIRYDMAEGWCFWQLGPKPRGRIGPEGGKIKRVQLWVHGDGSQDFIRLRVRDKTNQTFQPTACKLDFQGWRYLSMSLEGHMGHWGGPNDGVIRWPLTWMSYYLQDSTRNAHKGTVCVTGVVVAY